MGPNCCECKVGSDESRIAGTERRSGYCAICFSVFRFRKRLVLSRFTSMFACPNVRHPIRLHNGSCRIRSAGALLGLKGRVSHVKPGSVHAVLFGSSMHFQVAPYQSYLQVSTRLLVVAATSASPLLARWLLDYTCREAGAVFAGQLVAVGRASQDRFFSLPGCQYYRSSRPHFGSGSWPLAW